MAKKFAEITGIHRIFSKVEIKDKETGNSEYKYNTFEIDTDKYPELDGNIGENTIIFVTADNTDVNRIIGPNNYKISKDDRFIVSQNKVYATFGKVNVSDVMGPAGKDGVGVYSLTDAQKINMVQSINSVEPSPGVDEGVLVDFLKDFVNNETGFTNEMLTRINDSLKSWAGPKRNNINGSFIVDDTLFTRDMNSNNFKLQNYYDLKGQNGAQGPTGATGENGENGAGAVPDLMGLDNTQYEKFLTGSLASSLVKGDYGISTEGDVWVYTGSKLEKSNVNLKGQKGENGAPGLPGKPGESSGTTEIIKDSSPIGAITMYAGSSDSPLDGWLFCNGASINIKSVSTINIPGRGDGPDGEEIFTTDFNGTKIKWQIADKNEDYLCDLLKIIKGNYGIETPSTNP